MSRGAVVTVAVTVVITVAGVSGASSPWVDAPAGAPPAKARERGRALAAADLDGDLVPEVVVGGVVGGGGVVTVYPVDPRVHATAGAAARLRRPALGAPGVRRIVPDPAELVVAGDFDADGRTDVVVAARGARRLWCLRGDGRGGLGAPAALPLPGEVTALAAADVDRRDGLPDLLVGLAGDPGPRLLVLEDPHGALHAEPESTPLPEPAREIAAGELDGDPGGDVAAAAGPELVLVHGRDRHLLEPPSLRPVVRPPRVDRFALPVAIRALAVLSAGPAGRRIVVALDDGTVRPLDPLAGAGLGAPVARAGGRPLLVTAQTADWPTAGLVVLDAARAAAAEVVAGAAAGAEGRDRWPEPMVEAGIAPAPPTARAPVVRAAQLPLAGAIRAVLALRVDGDALDDLVVLGDGAARPHVLLARVTSTYTVNSTADPGDGVCDATECTLREALNAANSSAGQDIVEFAIGSGHQVVALASNLPYLTESVIVDGTTQPGYTGSPLIELDGSAVPFLGYGLALQGGGSTVKGLVINGFSQAGVAVAVGSSSTISDCYIGTDAAGTTAVANRYGVEIASSNNLVRDNLISGNDVGVYIHGSGASSNQVAGNLIGTDVTGNGLPAGLGSPAGGVSVEYAPDTTIGGAKAAEGNVIAGAGDGVDIFGGSASGALVEGNLIGLGRDGSTLLGAQFSGVAVQNAPSATIGGTTAATRNLVSGNGGNGVQVRGLDSVGTLVVGNFIGVDSGGELDRGNGGAGVLVRYGATGTAVIGDAAAFPCVISGNGGSGVLVEDGGSSGTTVAGCLIGTTLKDAAVGNDGDGITVDLSAGPNTFGDPAGTSGNTIAHNGGSGVAVRSGVGNAIRANGIHDNVKLGVDLDDDGVTADDAGDGDSGANGLQNFPLLTRVETDGSSLVLVEGGLESTPSSPFAVDLFASPTCDPSGYGEGAVFVAAKTVATDGAGMATFAGTFAASVPAGWVVTATATDPSGSTSELSPCFTVPAASLVFADDFEGADTGRWSRTVP